MRQRPSIIKRQIIVTAKTKQIKFTKLIYKMLFKPLIFWSINFRWNEGFVNCVFIFWFACFNANWLICCRICVKTFSFSNSIVIFLVCSSFSISFSKSSFNWIFNWDIVSNACSLINLAFSFACSRSFFTFSNKAVVCLYRFSISWSLKKIAFFLVVNRESKNWPPK